MKWNKAAWYNLPSNTCEKLQEMAHRIPGQMSAAIFATLTAISSKAITFGICHSWNGTRQLGPTTGRFRCCRHRHCGKQHGCKTTSMIIHCGGLSRAAAFKCTMTPARLGRVMNKSAAYWHCRNNWIILIQHGSTVMWLHCVNHTYSTWMLGGSTVKCGWFDFKSKKLSQETHTTHPLP